MDTFSLLQGVSGLTDYLSKDRYYLKKLIERQSDSSYLIESRVAHHNQLVASLNLVVSVAGGFPDGRHLFEPFVLDEDVLDNTSADVRVALPAFHPETGEVLADVDVTGLTADVVDVDAVTPNAHDAPSVSDDAVPEEALAPVVDAMDKSDESDEEADADDNGGWSDDTPDLTDITEAEHDGNEAVAELPVASHAVERETSELDGYVADSESSRMADEALTQYEMATAQHGPRREPHSVVSLFEEEGAPSSNDEGPVTLNVSDILIPSASSDDAVPIQQDIDNIMRGGQVSDYAEETHDEGSAPADHETGYPQEDGSGQPHDYDEQGSYPESQQGYDEQEPYSEHGQDYNEQEQQGYNEQGSYPEHGQYEDPDDDSADFPDDPEAGGQHQEHGHYDDSQNGW